MSKTSNFENIPFWAKFPLLNPSLSLSKENVSLWIRGWEENYQEILRND